MTRVLLKATDNSCGWTKGGIRHKETQRQNNDVSNSVSEKQKVWKVWNQGNTSKAKHLETKKKRQTECLAGQMESRKEKLWKRYPVGLSEMRCV